MWELIPLGFLLLLSAFFSACETAFLSLAEESAAELMAVQKRKKFIFIYLFKNPDLLLTTNLLCNNLVNLGASALAAYLTIQYFNMLSLAFTTGLLTLIVLIFGEVIPKQLAIRYNYKIVVAVAPVSWLLVMFLRPITFVIESFTRRVIPGLGQHEDEKMTLSRLVYTIEIARGSGLFNDSRYGIVKNLLYIDNLSAKVLMTHRKKIVAFEQQQSVAQVIEQLGVLEYSSLPVYAGDRERIVGVVASSDIIKSLTENKESLRLIELMTPPLFISENKKYQEMLTLFNGNNQKMAIVLDQFGGVAGLITAYDLLEQLVGTLMDDKKKGGQSAYIETIGEKSFLLCGETTVATLHGVCRLQLRTEHDLDKTVAGLILELCGHIPYEQEQIEYGDGFFKILTISDNYISSVVYIKNE